MNVYGFNPYNYYNYQPKSDEIEYESKPVYKIELYVTEMNDVFGIDDLKTTIENSLDNYSITFGQFRTKVVKKYHDGHPLNDTKKSLRFCRQLFAPKKKDEPKN